MVALIICFPILQALHGEDLFLGHPITVAETYTHIQILTALKLVTPSDSYICVDKMIDKAVLDGPEDLRDKHGSWVGWGYGTNIKRIK